jgi:hypothetical protein
MNLRTISRECTYLFITQTKDILQNGHTTIKVFFPPHVDTIVHTLSSFVKCFQIVHYFVDTHIKVYSARIMVLYLRLRSSTFKDIISQLNPCGANNFPVRCASVLPLAPTVPAHISQNRPYVTAESVIVMVPFMHLISHCGKSHETSSWLRSVSLFWKDNVSFV